MRAGGAMKQHGRNLSTCSTEYSRAVWYVYRAMYGVIDWGSVCTQNCTQNICPPFGIAIRRIPNEVSGMADEMPLDEFYRRKYVDAATRQQ